MSRQTSSHIGGTGPKYQAPSMARTRPDFRRNYRDYATLRHFEDGSVYGHAVCTQCHAIWDRKHWHLNEEEYRQLRSDDTVEKVVCPACVKIEREEYDGHVILQSPLIPKNEEAIIGLIYNTEQHIREHNPLARIASLTVRGDTIEVLTITPFLAERIGKELRKAYHGTVEFKHPTRQNFVRVSWYRE
jgi:hypothetical protein